MNSAAGRDVQLEDQGALHDDVAGAALLGYGFVHRAVDRKHLGQARNFEHLQDPLVGADEGQVPVVAAQPLEPSNEHPETSRVQEIDPFEVDNDLVLALADQLNQLLAQPGAV